MLKRASLEVHYVATRSITAQDMICPFAGYKALSDIVFACNWCGWPRPEAYRARMRCVHEDFVEECGQVLPSMLFMLFLANPVVNEYSNKLL